MPTHLTTTLLRSPPAEYLLSNLRALLLGALRCGPIPRHIAFVMDGNRRYAKQHNLETVEGHNLGFEAMARILEICYNSGVHTVTIYAFSIENFKRSRAEVDALMDMARVKLVQLAQHGELFERFGARVEILGQRELLRGDVAEAIDEAVRLTRHNRKAVLNVCFPYTSRDEMTTAVRRTVAQYCEPLPDEKGRRRRPVLFSQERIARNVRARRLSTLREESGSRSPRPEGRVAEGAVMVNGDGARQHEGALTTNGDTTTPAQNGEAHPITNGETPSTSTTTSTTHSSSTSLSSSSATLTQSSQSSPPSPPSPPHSPSPPTSLSHPTTTTLPNPETITTHTLTQNLYTAHSPPLDLLIRTSGVERLSDFLLWQCHQRTSIVFVKCLWPEFGLLRFLPVLAEWQWWRLRAGFEGVEYNVEVEGEQENLWGGEEEVTGWTWGGGMVEWAGKAAMGLLGFSGGGGSGRVKKLG